MPSFAEPRTVRHLRRLSTNAGERVGLDVVRWSRAGGGEGQPALEGLPLLVFAVEELERQAGRRCGAREAGSAKDWM